MSIICGPIVRHTNRSQLNIWQVVDTPIDSVSLNVYESCDDMTSITSEVNYRCIQIGTSCYVVLVTATINPTEHCERIYYDVIINGLGFGNNDFYQQICLGDDTLPSVAIPHVHRHLSQASCRKPHDLEGIDQLAALSELVAKQLTSESRPSQLFLTGDQIYADDVSPILLQSFEAVREQLGLAHEEVYTAENSCFDPDSIHLDTRGSKATKNDGFTSGEKDSHLLTFAEYFCMTLFSLGALLPNQQFASYRTLKPRLSYRSHKHGKRVVKKYKLSNGDYNKQLRALELFQQRAPNQVRKLLANISVYMIFDDHDVTDDWNLTQTNKINLSTSTLGRQVYVNALSAYLVCQHWGNQPQDVTAALSQKIERLALEPNKENHTTLETLFSKYWGYQLEQSPPAVILDTRTQRVYAGDKLELMSSQRISALGNELADLPPSSTLLLISPTPVYGFSSIEAVQLDLPIQLQTSLDREPWIASETALKNLQNALLNTPGIKHIVIFSGDVHYGFSRRQYLQDDDVTLWQLTSSAACNSPAGGNIGLPLLSYFGQLFDKQHTKYLLPEGEKKHFLTRDKNVGTLTLDQALTPLQAKLLCCTAYGEPYTKTYNLVNYKEYPE